MATSSTRPQKRSWFWLQGLLCGAAVSLFPATCIVAGALLAPAILAAYSETTLKRPVGRAMIMMALATAIGPLRSLWRSGDTLDGALAIVSDPAALALAWVAAASAWVISEGVGLIGFHVSTSITGRRSASLKKEHAELKQEWGA